MAKLNMVQAINLALQGGGAHGAFTWGVLDRLLQDENIEINAISGTSAGYITWQATTASGVAPVTARSSRTRAQSGDPAW